MERMVESIDGSNRGNKQKELVCSKIMNCIPFTLLLENYRTCYRSFCLLLMMMHFCHMIPYSIVVLPHVIEMTKTINATEITPYLRLRWPVWIDWFLLWPTFLLISVICLWFSSLARGQSTSLHCSCHFHFRLVRVIKQFFVFITENFRLLSTTAYTIASIIVHFFLRYGTTPQTLIECTAVSVLLGWLVILHFARGTNDLIFASMVKRIILRDIGRFLFMYLSILCGFGFALHALFQLSPVLSNEFILPWDTIFALFNMLLGIDSQFDTVYQVRVEKSPLVYTVYIFYIFLASILLINLLIAMMTNTYNERKKMASQDWRIGSLKVCFRVERLCSPLRKVRAWCAPYRICFHERLQGYMMYVPRTEDEPMKKRIRKSVMYQAMLRVEDNVNRLQAEVTRALAQYQASERRSDTDRPAALMMAECTVDN